MAALVWFWARSQRGVDAKRPSSMVFAVLQLAALPSPPSPFLFLCSPRSHAVPPSLSLPLPTPHLHCARITGTNVIAFVADHTAIKYLCMG